MQILVWFRFKTVIFVFFLIHWKDHNFESVHVKTKRYQCKCTGDFGGLNCDHLECPSGFTESGGSIGSDTCDKQCTADESIIVLSILLTMFDLNTNVVTVIPMNIHASFI